MFRIVVRQNCVIEGCPKSGVEAVDFRRENGISEAPTNTYRVEVDVEREELARQLPLDSDANFYVNRYTSETAYRVDPLMEKQPITPELSVAAIRELEAGEPSAAVLEIHAAIAEVERRAEGEIYDELRERLKTAKLKAEILNGNMHSICIDGTGYWAWNIPLKTWEVIESEPAWEVAKTEAIDNAVDRWLARSPETLPRGIEREAAEATDYWQDRQRAKAAEEEEERQLEEARERETEAWLRTHAPEFVDQYRDGLLGEDRIVNLIRDHYLTPFADFPSYQKIKLSEVCMCEWDRDCRLSCEQHTPGDLSPDEYAQFRQVRDLAKSVGFDATATQHDCETDECEQACSRKSVLVSGVAVGRRISRRYALGS